MTDVCKWNFDVCTDQIKIERKRGAAHNAGTAVYQVVGAIINSVTINYFYLFIGSLSATQITWRQLEGR